MIESNQQLAQITPILEALGKRDLDQSTMQRVFHGRGHTFPGLDFITVDWYPPALFVCVFKKVEQSWLDQLIELLWEKRPNQVEALVLQQRQGVNTVSEVMRGELPSPHMVKEQDRLVYVQLNNSQNVGIFPDMVKGRDWVTEHSDSKNVLNLFAYTCLFSVAALKGGARQVINVDMNKSVMATGRKNHQINDVDLNKVKFFTHNIFNSWGKIKRYGAYDLIIIDPPSFQKGSFVLTKDYQRLIKRLPDLAEQKADVLLCLNSPEVDSQYINDLVIEHCPQLQFVERLKNHPDFPEKELQKSLKVMWFKFD